MIEIDNVQKSFGDLDVVKGVSLTVNKGEVVSIIGGSGSGKSTLLMCINGLEPIQKGNIRVDGVEVHHRATDLNHLRQKIGIVFQQWNAFPHLTVLENVMVANKTYAAHPWSAFWGFGQRRKAVDEAMHWLQTMHLSHQADVSAQSLSYGEARRLEIARALAGYPSLLLLDEPTEGIQPSIIEEIAETLTALRKQRSLTIVLVEQNLDFIASVSERVLVIKRGQITGEIPREHLNDLDIVSEYTGVSSSH